MPETSVVQYTTDSLLDQRADVYKRLKGEEIVIEELFSLQMDDKVKDIMLIGKEGEKIVTCQPQTVKELIEFKQKCPNAQVVIVKASEQK